MPRKKKVARSAKSGEFVSATEAAESPDTTVVETIQTADPNALLDHLESLAGAVDDEAKVQGPDEVKAALNQIHGGIVTLMQTRRNPTSFGLRPRVDTGPKRRGA